MRTGQQTCGAEQMLPRLPYLKPGHQGQPDAGPLRPDAGPLRARCRTTAARCRTTAGPMQDHCGPDTGPLEQQGQG